MALSISTAELVGMIIHSTLYGLYIVLFIGSLYVPWSRRRRYGRGGQPINIILLTVTIILFFLITIHWVLQFTRLVDAFVYHYDDEGGPDAYYEYAANIKNVVKTAFYVAQTFVGDFTMVYRLYVVWGRNLWVIILPCLTSFGLLVAGSGVVYEFSHLSQNESVFITSAGHWVLTVFATTLTTNIIVTVLIAYRIWSIHRPVKGIAQNSLMPVVQIILESAAIYTIVLILTLVGYLAKNNYQFITLDATSPAIGISFALIIVRVGMGLSSERTQAPPPENRIGFTTNVSNTMPLRGISVNVNKEVTMDTAQEEEDRRSSGTKVVNETWEAI